MADGGYNPQTGKGALMWIGMGLGGGLVALLISTFFPSIIPASAQGVKL